MAALDPSASAPLRTSLTTTDPTATSTSQIINIGTRKSALALKQTEIVTKLLEQAWPENEYKIHAISTMGDKNQVTALHDFGAKSLWTHELEAMLLAGEVDMIVHSLKDIPTQLPPDCDIGAILGREDARDALVMHPSLPAPTTLSSLPPDSTIGTSSVRRSAQLKRLYPHLRFQSVRGNVGTRLRKLDESVLERDGKSVRQGGGTKRGDSRTVDEDDTGSGACYSALILAAAGLTRLDLGHRITRLLSSIDAEVTTTRASSHSSHSTEPAIVIESDGHPLNARQNPPPKPEPNKEPGILHAVGQGALGIEIRSTDDGIRRLLGPLKDHRTTLACYAERSLMRTLEGGCSVPIGVETEWSDGWSTSLDTNTTTHAEPATSSTTMEAVQSLVGAGAAASSGSAFENQATPASSSPPQQQSDLDPHAQSAPPHTLTMRAIVVSLDGTTAVSASDTRAVFTNDEAENFGFEIARRLVEAGAEDILKNINLDRSIIEAQGAA